MLLVNLTVQNSLGFPTKQPCGKSSAGGETSFEYWLDLHRRFPDGTEFYPPTEIQGESEPGSQKDFYMIFTPGFPQDLKGKLIGMFQDPSIDRQRFIDMYSITFEPVSPTGTIPAWNSSWKHCLKETIIETEALSISCAPDCAVNMRAMDVLRKKLLTP